MKLALLFAAQLAAVCALINFGTGFTQTGALCLAVAGAAWLWWGYIRWAEESDRLDEILQEFDEWKGINQ